MKGFFQKHKGFLITLTAGLLIVFTVHIADAQKGVAVASIDSANILIGDHVHLKLTYTAPANATINWPVFKDTITNRIEIVELGSSDSSSSAGAGQIMRSQLITISCYDSGSFVIPAIPFSHRLPNDTHTYISYTSPITLSVNTVAVDTTQAIKDIKAPLSSPLTLLEILPWVGGGLLLAAIVALVIYIILRRKRKKPVFGRAAAPALPAHIVALQALETLRTERLWQQGKNKEYHSLLSEILRAYIDRRFGIMAMEMITPDVIASLQQQAKVEMLELNRLKHLLELSDRVKFAKFFPLPDEHDSALQQAILFVKVTAEKSEEVPALKPETPQDFISSELKQQENKDTQ